MHRNHLYYCICENEGGDRFFADPVKADIFYANGYFYVSQKKNWNQTFICLTHQLSFI